MSGSPHPWSRACRAERASGFRASDGQSRSRWSRITRAEVAWPHSVNSRASSGRCAGGKIRSGSPPAHAARAPRPADVATDWLVQLQELVEAGRRSPSTVSLYRHALDRHVLPTMGSLRLSDLTPARLDHFLHLKRREKGYATAKLCRAVLSGVCGLAVRREGLRVNPVRDVSSLEARGERQARALTIDEIHDWLAVLDGSEFARRKDLPDLARFLLGTGCRLGEAVGVHWRGRRLRASGGAHS